MTHAKNENFTRIHEIRQLECFLLPFLLSLFAFNNIKKFMCNACLLRNYADSLFFLCFLHSRRINCVKKRHEINWKKCKYGKSKLKMTHFFLIDQSFFYKNIFSLNRGFDFKIFRYLFKKFQIFLEYCTNHTTSD